ncbi:ABC transporter permease [candidate division KSB1 bacterium]
MPKKKNKIINLNIMKKPPKIARRILSVTNRNKNRKIILGDFEEFYNEIYRDSGALKANIWYYRQALISVPVFLKTTIYWSFIMFRNYFKIALRNIKKYKMYSFLNISGLAIGLACCMLILLWVHDEISFDRFHENAKNIYRIELEVDYAGRKVNWPVVSIPMGPSFKEQIPEIVESLRFNNYQALLKRKDIEFFERGCYADPSFFTMFSFKMLKGDKNKIFDGLYSIVITKSLSEKFFGKEDPIGKTLKIGSNDYFTVTGVIEDFPQNSHIKYDFITPYALFVQRDHSPENWGRFHTYTYTLLQETAAGEQIAGKMTGIFKQNWDRFKGKVNLIPLTKLHLLASGGSKNIYIFSMIAGFILLIAGMNFMSMTTARSSRRAKEIGIRKIVGARKGNLIKQFLGESYLLTIISFVLAMALVYLLLPGYSQITGKQLNLGMLLNIKILCGFIFIVFITGLISGSYPALLLSSIKPLNILKGYLLPERIGGKSGIFRKIIVVIQFSISILLIICTLVIFDQLQYINQKDLGFDKEQLMFFSMSNKISSQLESIKSELLRDPRVQNVTASSELPADIGWTKTGFDWEGKSENIGDDFSMYMAAVDQNYFTTFNIEVVQGRGFFKELQTDFSNYILNESAVKVMGLQDPVGKRFVWQDRNGSRKGVIVGVVKDFHFKSLHAEISPLAFIPEPSRFNYLCLKINAAGNELISTIDYVKKTWIKFEPDVPFRYSFLSDISNSMYKKEQRTGRIFSGFSILAVLVSCLGLFGLSAYVSEQKTKEIGIRKVFGASLYNILNLISKEFLLLIIVGNIISWPVGYYVMIKWLENFAYHTDLSIFMFLFSGLLAFIITLFTISYQSLKAASANPVDSLKYE